MFDNHLLNYKKFISIVKGKLLQKISMSDIKFHGTKSLPSYEEFCYYHEFEKY